MNEEPHVPGHEVISNKVAQWLPVFHEPYVGQDWEYCGGTMGGKNRPANWKKLRCVVSTFAGHEDD
jgi:hypothetical protein